MAHIHEQRGEARGELGWIASLIIGGGISWLRSRFIGREASASLFQPVDELNIIFLSNILYIFSI
jgi:hypothetical protein